MFDLATIRPGAPENERTVLVNHVHAIGYVTVVLQGGTIQAIHQNGKFGELREFLRISTFLVFAFWSRVELVSLVVAGV